MASIFKKMKAGGSATDEEQGNVKTKKPNERLSSVVSESAVSGVIDILQQNRQFTLPNERAWVVLLLLTDGEFGGLSKKQANQEAKSSIIQLIETSKIHTVVTPELLNDEALGFIPNEQTLGYMREFSILRNADLWWGVVEQDEHDPDVLHVNGVNVPEPGERLVPPAFDQAVDIAAGTRSLADVMPQVWEEYLPDMPAEDDVEHDDGPGVVASDDGLVFGGNELTSNGAHDPEDDHDEDIGAQTDGAEGVADDEGDIPEGYEEPDDGIDFASLAEEEGDSELVDEPDFDENEAFDEDDAPDWGGVDEEPIDEEVFFDEDGSEEIDQDPYADDSFMDGAADSGYQDYIVANEGRVVTQEEVADDLVRRFLGGDVELDITLGEFEKTFNTAADTIDVQVVDSEGREVPGWLASQVSQLIHQANAEISQVRQDHIDTMRSHFVEVMSKHVEGIIDKVDHTREGTVYFDAMQAADAEFDEKRRRHEEERQQRIKDLVASYERRADAAADAAASTARNQFYQRYGPQHEEQLASVSTEIQQEAIELRNDRQAAISERMQKEATLRLDYGVTYTLSMLMREVRPKQLELENALRKEWYERIHAEIDKYRADDIARAEALAKQLEQSEALQQARQESRESLEAQAAEYDRRVEQLRLEREQERKDFLHELEEQALKFANEMDRKDAELLNYREKYEEMSETQHERELALKQEFDAERRTWREESSSLVDRVQVVNKTMNNAWVFFLILLVVIGLGAGIVGYLWGLGS